MNYFLTVIKDGKELKLFKRIDNKSVSLGLVVLFFYTSLGLTDITLTGKVTRNDGITLPGVKVDLFADSLLISSGTTDVNGNYSITCGTESVWVFVSHPGYYANLSTGIVVNTGLTKILNVVLSTAPAGLVGYWKFNEGSGIIAFDYSGNANHGILRNGPKWLPGIADGVLSFDGTDDYVLVSISSSIPYADVPRTLEARVYVRYTSWGNDQHTIFEYGAVGDRNAFGIDMDLYPLVEFYTYKDNLAVDASPTSYEGWLYLTSTYDGFTDLAGYVNGKFKGNKTTGSQLTTAVTDVNIGRAIRKGVPWVFDGLIDEIRLYNRALRPVEIKEDMVSVYGTISGRVIQTDTKSPLPDTLVQFLSDSLAVSSVTTNSDGYFTLNLTAGSYNLRTVRTGYQTSLSSTVYVTPGYVTRYDIEMNPLELGKIYTYAGVGTAAYSGDGRIAHFAELNAPRGLVIDNKSNIYITEFDGHRVRKIDPAEVINTIAGAGTPGFSGEDYPAIYAKLNTPTGVDTDYWGNVYIADYLNHSIRKIETNGKIFTIAGTGIPGYTGDGQPANESKLFSPQGICLDKSGNLYIADMGNYRIRKVDVLTGLISTVAGIGIPGYSGDKGLAKNAKLNAPTGVFVDITGNIYIADSSNHRIRKVDINTGIITTVAGSGLAGFSGDGGLAVTAKLNTPKNVYVDVLGNLYISDYGNHCIRKVDTTGIITTVAGTGGSAGFSGDGGLAVNAQLDGPGQIFMDSIGNLYIADQRNNRIRKVFLGLPIGTLTGKVTKSDGITAMSNVLVEVLSGTVVVKSTVTDSTGNYTLSLTTGVFTVQASYLGYQTVTTKNDVMVKQIEPTILSFSLLPESTIPILIKPVTKNVGEINIFGGNSSTSRGAINPTKGEKAVIGFKGSSAGTFYLRIFNLFGELIYLEDKQFNSAEGYFEWFPPDNLAPDIYIVSIDGPGIKMKKKIAIVK